jgi:hypothetical protein
MTLAKMPDLKFEEVFNRKDTKKSAKGSQSFKSNFCEPFA